MKIIYSIKDTAVQAFAQPFFMRSQGEMMRSLQDEVNNQDKKSTIAAHPADYELYEIGSFDEQTGKLKEQEPKLIVRCKDLIIQPQ